VGKSITVLPELPKQRTEEENQDMQITNDWYKQMEPKTI
jgi:hypothetical protein